MQVVRDENGKVICRSRNMRGIRQYVIRQRLWYDDPIKVLAIDRLSGEAGKLMILFGNNDSYECNFASFMGLKLVISRWRSVYGAPLRVNGEDCGKVSRDNIALVANETPLTDTQKAVLRTFSRTGMATVKDMKGATQHYRPALQSLMRQGLVMDAQKDCGEGQYALTHNGGAAMPGVMGEGWEKPW